jgi:hypothetical protein
MWTSKIGATGKPLILGLTLDDSLVTFAGLTGPGGAGVPQLRFRLRNGTTTLSRDVTAYTDVTNDPPKYNAQVEFDDFTGIEPGVYICEVDASQAGEEHTFPDDGYFLIKFLPGVNS